MKALTLKHLWPFAICHWGKRIENRSWLPPPNLIGQRFAIHGGKPPASQAAMEDIRRTFEMLCQIHDLPTYRVDGDLTLRDLIMPGIVATVVLDRTVRASRDPWFDSYVEGNVGWVLRDVIVLPTPIPCRGAQGLWEIPQDVVDQIESAVAA